jgi:hypothetical protein
MFHKSGDIEVGVERLREYTYMGKAGDRCCSSNCRRLAQNTRLSWRDSSDRMSILGPDIRNHSLI